MDTRHLLARAADTELTYPERAAALSAAARSSLPDDTWPTPPPGWTWRDGRVVLCSSVIPPLQVRTQPSPIHARPIPIVDEEVEPVEQSTQAVQVVGSEATKPKTIRPPQPGSKAARLLDMLRRPEGVSVTEAVEELGCKPISIKGMVSIYSRRVGGRAVYDNGRYMMR